MKQLNRNQAEELLNKYNVLNSDVYQDKDRIKITLILSNQKKFLMDYSIFTKEKNYFIFA